MSKKKSYMDIGNIIKEDIFSAFFRGLFGIKKDYKKEEKKIKKQMQKNVDRFNNGTDLVYQAINKTRKSAGLKPKKPDYLTVKDVLKKLDK